ncbi:MAG: Ribose-phosphate pyrophosphokinase [uncultured bacterium]|nr:MAG: Ribose-phosphate pyrophosphokinase [uncultured bacterium]HBD05567.1 hypothetical protein [Candidatus Uhrbacteria bacterium]
MILFYSANALHLQDKRSDIKIAKYQKSYFANSEISYRILTQIKHKDTTLMASIGSEPETFFELLSLQRAIKENSAGKHILIVPYFAYARQDRKTKSGEASIGVMLAEMIRNTNHAHVYAFDVHSRAITSRLGEQFTNISVLPLFAKELKRINPEVIVAPDEGSHARAKALAEILGTQNVAVIEKFRPKPNTAVAKRIRGEVSGLNALIVDDMIDTGGTAIACVNMLKKHNAASVSIAATHGIFSDNAIEKLLKTGVREIITTNTLLQKKHAKVKVVDIRQTIHNLFV